MKLSLFFGVAINRLVYCCPIDGTSGIGGKERNCTDSAGFYVYFLHFTFKVLRKWRDLWVSRQFHLGQNLIYRFACTPSRGEVKKRTEKQARCKLAKTVIRLNRMAAVLYVSFLSLLSHEESLRFQGQWRTRKLTTKLHLISQENRALHRLRLKLCRKLWEIGKKRQFSSENQNFLEKALAFWGLFLNDDVIFLKFWLNVK